MSILIIPDLHIDITRTKAIKFAFENFYSKIVAPAKEKTMGYDNTVLLGDIFNSYPNIEERILFAEFIETIRPITGNIILIKGTKSHDFSHGLYNLEDIIKLTNIRAVEQLEIKYNDKNILFLHEDIQGLKYSNGHETENGMITPTGKTIYAGHYHSPGYDKKRDIYVVGSIYKTDLSEINDKKRIITVDGKKIKSIEIESRPMYQWILEGKGDKVTFADLEICKSLKEKSEIDLKIIANTDNITLPKIQKLINQIKTKFIIEYYQQDISITEIKVDVPKNLDQVSLLKKYCTDKQVPYELVEKEIK
jgi:predicted phosphodiesterase